MSNKTQPKNQWALAIKLLIDKGNEGVTMVDACNHYFFKYQTRLGEIERSIGSDGKQRKYRLKIRRMPITKKNRFGHTMTFTHYKSLASKSYLNNLLKKLNEHGLNQPTK